MAVDRRSDSEHARSCSTSFSMRDRQLGNLQVYSTLEYGAITSSIVRARCTRVLEKTEDDRFPINDGTYCCMVDKFFTAQFSSPTKEHRRQQHVVRRPRPEPEPDYGVQRSPGPTGLSRHHQSWGTY